MGRKRGSPPKDLHKKTTEKSLGGWTEENRMMYEKALKGKKKKAQPSSERKRGLLVTETTGRAGGRAALREN